MRRSPAAMALDVDGTLLDPDHRLRPVTVEAVHRLRADGVLVVIASSRPPVALRAVAVDLGLVGSPVVACQGAVQGRFDEAGHFHTEASLTLVANAAETVTALGRERGVAANWYVGEHWFTEHIDEGVAREARITECTPTVVAHLGSSLGEPLKILFTASTDNASLLPEIRDKMPKSVDVTSPDPLYLDVIAPGVDKWAALVATFERFDIPLHETVAIGDGENDLGMITGAGFGIAMGQAAPAVRAAADHVTLSNSEDGVAAAVAHLLG